VVFYDVIATFVNYSVRNLRILVILLVLWHLLSNCGNIS